MGFSSGEAAHLGSDFGNGFSGRATIAHLGSDGLQGPSDFRMVFSGGEPAHLGSVAPEPERLPYSALVMRSTALNTHILDFDSIFDSNFDCNFDSIFDSNFDRNFDSNFDAYLTAS